jgi:hypothetical protein
MNYVSLITHGLSGISVYADTIYVRLLVLSVLLFAFTAIVVPALLASLVPTLVLRAHFGFCSSQEPRC